MKILTLNCGSSSVKYSLWEMLGPVPLCQGIIERVAMEGSLISHRTTRINIQKLEVDCPDHDAAINLIFEYLLDSEAGIVDDLSEIDAVAHRVVHGGEKYTHSVQIDDDV